MKVTPVSYQLAFFTGNINLSDKLEVAEKIKQNLGQILDGSPTLLPIPDDAPLEIPRIIFPSKDNKFIINISQSRVDFIRNRNLDTSKKDDIESEFTWIKNSISKLVIDELKASVYRLGVVFNFRIKLKTSAIDYIKNNYKLTKNNPLQLEFNQQIRREIEKMKANQWIRLTARDFDIKGEDKEKLNVLIDINTIKEEKYDINQGSAVAFFDESLKISSGEVESL